MKKNYSFGGETELKLEERLERELVRQSDGRLFIRRCCICHSVEIGGEIFSRGEYEEVLDSFAREYAPILPGRPLPQNSVSFLFTDTLLSRECVSRTLVGQPKYYQKDGFTLLGRYSAEDVQSMKAYQSISREKCG